MDLTKHTPGHVSVSVKMKRAVWNVTAALLFRPFPRLLKSGSGGLGLRAYRKKMIWGLVCKGASGFGA